MASKSTSDAYLGDTLDFNLRFPPLHKTLTEITQLAKAGSDMPDTPRLAEVVRADPIVAAFILRRINSVYHSVRRSVDDVGQAVRLLGFREVCHIGLTAGMEDDEDMVPILLTGARATIFRDIMKVSLGASYFAQELAASFFPPLKNKAFTVGLQHAIGRLVLLHHRPRHYVALWEGVLQDFGPRAGEERRVFGADHAELGARVLLRWNYPESITSVIRNYQKPGALKDHHLRVLALMLSVAVTASEQLCLSMTSNRGKPFFTPTSAAHALARLMKQPSSVVVEAIQPHHGQARDYIDGLLKR